MLKHRKLTLKTFCHRVPWELFQRYFEGISLIQQPSAWIFLNEEVMEQSLSDLQNAEASGAIQEDFRRINDIAAEGTSLLVQAYFHA